MLERDRLNKDQFDPEELPYQVPPDEAAADEEPTPEESDSVLPEEIDPDTVDPERLVKEGATAGLDADSQPEIPDEPPPGLVELVRYPLRQVADMLMPWLEEAEIGARLEVIDGSAVEGETTPPRARGVVRIMVPRKDIDEAQRLWEQFEIQREHMRAARAQEEEPQRIERPEDE